MENNEISRFYAPQIVGYVAGALTVACVVPQIYKAIKTRSTSDISYGFLLCLSMGLVLWFVYGILIGEIPVMIPNAISLALNITLLVLKVWYDKYAVLPESTSSEENC